MAQKAVGQAKESPVRYAERKMALHDTLVGSQAANGLIQDPEPTLYLRRGDFINSLLMIMLDRSGHCGSVADG